MREEAPSHTPHRTGGGAPQTESMRGGRMSETKPGGRSGRQTMEDRAGDAAIRAAARLRTHLPDIVRLPGAPAYEAARQVYFTGVDRHPSLVLSPRTPEEVAEAVRIVASEGARLTVRGGGHGFTSRGVASGLPMLDLSRLGQVRIDPATRKASVGGGTTTGALTRSAGAHGLAVGFGDSPKVGVGGITQAGGIGFLHRCLGLSIDQLAGAQIVTADGVIREVNQDREPDLFWALRGGGGGFGVVTRLDFRLAPVDRVVGGMLMAPTDAEGFHRALQLLETAPPEVSGLLQAFRAPAMELVPQELQGSLALAAFLVHSGTADEAEAWTRAFRSSLRPVLDTLAPLPYPALFDDHGGPPNPPFLRWRSAFREPLSETEVEALFALLEEPGDAIMRTLQLRPLGGAVDLVSGGATAFAHRGTPLLASGGAVYAAGADPGPHRAWVQAIQEVLEGGDPRGAYAGFLGDEDPEGPNRAWPGAHGARLRRIKDRCDPRAVFHAPSCPPTEGRAYW
jgi:FAD/FMN-containing dehydrogenase